MKILLNILIILNLSFGYTQTKMDSLILSSKLKSELVLNELVDEKILTENFDFKKENIIVEIYNISNERLERLNLSEFEQSSFKPTQYWISYNLTIKERILTKLDLPFDIKGNLKYSKSGIEEILNPYLKVLEHKTKINLEKAIEISKKNILGNVENWDINYEDEKLVWTLESSFKKGRKKVIKLDSKSGKIIAELIEIKID